MTVYFVLCKVLIKMKKIKSETYAVCFCTDQTDENKAELGIVYKM